MQLWMQMAGVAIMGRVAGISLVRVLPVAWRGAQSLSRRFERGCQEGLMPAGESAWQEAQRRRAAADRHHAAAELLRRQARALEKGAAGEAVTARVLDRLVPEGWLRVEDRRWPERVRANIDRIVVGPGGVFVIDSKHWSVTPQVRTGVLVAGGRNREREVAAAADAAIAVSSVVPVDHRDHVVPPDEG